MIKVSSDITVSYDEPHQEQETKYSEAKTWQIATFAENNTATNMCNFLICSKYTEYIDK
jgi:hypothetical protein